MARNRFSFFVAIIVGLAVLGLFSQLTGNTLRFFINISIMIGVALAIYAVIYFVFIKNDSRGSDEMKKYKQAVKQSKAKYGQTNNYRSDTSKPLKKRKGRRVSHLRVIEGNKEKKKDSAISE